MKLKQLKALAAQRHELYLKAYQERMDNWFAAHPDKKYFEPTLQEIRVETKPDEWLWHFMERIQYPPEQRYQQEKNPTHGWNHSSTVHGIEDKDCKEGCRFWPAEGRIETLEILEDYKEYQGYDEFYKKWIELEEYENNKAE